MLIGQVALRVPANKRSLASGVVNAGGSLGQFVFAPVTQVLISAFGWMSAMWTMAVAALATLPLARPLVGKVEEPAQPVGAAPAPAPITLREQLRIASRDRSYWLLHAGFFTCGFHIAFLVTHLPGEVGLCSLPASVAARPDGVRALEGEVAHMGAHPRQDRVSVVDVRQGWQRRHASTLPPAG